jgi:hypothetical protein
MSLPRNLGRRKLRTTLTILGIVIGIWALVVFSAMANKINTLFASGSDYYVGKVVVTDGSTGGLGVGLVPIDVGLADQIRSLDGVAAVDPQVQMPFEDLKPTGFGIPKLIRGPAGGQRTLSLRLLLQRGRHPRSSSRCRVPRDSTAMPPTGAAAWS